MDETDNAQGRLGGDERGLLSIKKMRKGQQTSGTNTPGVKGKLNLDNCKLPEQLGDNTRDQIDGPSCDGMDSKPGQTTVETLDHG